MPSIKSDWDEEPPSFWEEEPFDLGRRKGFEFGMSNPEAPLHDAVLGYTEELVKDGYPRKDIVLFSAGFGVGFRDAQATL